MDDDIRAARPQESVAAVLKVLAILQAIAGLSASFPTCRCDLAREPKRAGMPRDASRAITRQMGCMVFPLDG